AQQPVDPVATTQTASFLEVIQQTGLMIYPLAILSIAAVFLILFYVMTIREGAVVTEKFMNAADALIRKQDYLGLLAVCNRHNESVSRITEKALDFATKNPTASFEEVREVAESEGTRQASLLSHRITYLADVGSIAPMVGLLGTVIGMIKSFREVGQHVPLGDKQDGLAGGVAEALLTTAGGLCIGIPAMIFYSLFRGRVQRLISEMEAAATHLLALLSAQYKRAETRSGVSTPTAIPRSPVEDSYQTEYPMGDRTIDHRTL
ncbi:MAG: MotA/TolQ/ExbB proton channel family protein, partial [Verrucomicrobiota bacterium]